MSDLHAGPGQPPGRTLTYDEYREAFEVYHDAYERLEYAAVGKFFRPCIPTPWRGLHRQIGREAEGIHSGQVVSISSGNHYFASKILRRLRAYVTKLGYPCQLIECKRGQTPIDKVAAEVGAAAKAACPVIIVDWFPNVDLTERWRESKDEPLTFEFQGMEFFNEVCAAARFNEVLVLVGACMSANALEAGATEDAGRYPIRGNKLVEDRCDYSMLCWPDEQDQSRTWGKLLRTPNYTNENLPAFSFEDPAVTG